MKRLTINDFYKSVDSSVESKKPKPSSLTLEYKIKKNSFSIFIPCFKLDGKRKRNLEFTYKRLSERDFHTVIAVQGEHNDYYNKFENVKFFSKEGDFNKSFILNRCLELVETDFFVFLDADVYFNFDSLSTLELDDEIVKPFRECTYLTDDITQEFIDKRKIKIPTNTKKISAVGGGALAIRSDLIKSKNLNFDEKFTGWGWEDIDFGDQIRSKGLKVRVIDQPAIHLYHEPYQHNERNNSLHYSSKTKIKSKIVHIFSSDNSDLSSINSFVANKTSDVLLINCAKVDQINNPNVKFIYSNRIDSAYLTDLAGEFVDDQGWIVCTQGSFVAEDRFYLEINNKTEDYHVLGQAEGFILKQILSPCHNPIYLKVKNGLANRMRSICSFAKFAEQNKRHLFVNWTKGSGFSDESFEDLFESLPNFVTFISDEEYQTYTAKILKLHQEIFKDENKPETYVSKINIDVLFSKLEDEFCYEGDSCLEYMFPNIIKGNYNETKFLKKLIPKKEIKEKVDDIVKLFNQNTVGVHIRKGDAVLSPWKKYYKVSTLDSFKSLMKDKISKDHLVKFFLSTDCEDVELEMRKEFPDKILIQEKPYSRVTDHNLNKPFQKEALIDLICLSRTTEIIGSYWSSFSLCAADLGEIPLKIARHSYDKNVSLIVACKDREDALKISLQSWIKFKEIAEIIIVDWSSENSIKFLENIDPRIKVISVSDKNEFCLSAACNLAARYATKDFILKMDADYILNPYCSIFDYDLLPAEFLTGNYKDDKLDNSLGFLSFLNGMILIRRLDFWSVGGYSEDLTGYGYDDCDLHNKLESEGMIRRFLDHKCLSIFHVPHSDFERTKNYSNKNISNSLKSNVSRSNARIKKPIVMSCPNIMDTYRLNSNDFLKKVGNNTGNLVHQRAVCDLIKDTKLFAPDLDYNHNRINKECRALVVPSSSFLSTHFSDDFINFIEKIEIPIIFVGIGIGSKNYEPPTKISNASLRLIELIDKRKLPIGVRGSITKSFLNQHGVSSVFEIGCPSNFMNKNPDFYLQLSEKFKKYSRDVIFNQDNIWSDNLNVRNVEKMLFRNFIEMKSVLVQQSYFVDCIRNKDEPCLEKVRLSLAPDISPDYFNKLISQFRIYVSIDQWMEDASRMDLSIGLRMHGNMVAHQSGCPAVWIYHDARTKELTETMELPRISVEEAASCSTVEDVKSKSIVDFEKYAKKRVYLWNNICDLFDQFGINI